MKVKVIEISLHWESDELWPLVAFAHTFAHKTLKIMEISSLYKVVLSKVPTAIPFGTEILKTSISC